MTVNSKTVLDLNNSRINVHYKIFLKKKKKEENTHISQLDDRSFIVTSQVIENLVEI